MISVVTLSVSCGLLVFLSFSQAVGSSAPPTPQLLGPQPPFSILQPELSATQRSASTNQECTLTPSLVEVEGTPQQIEGPYFVDDMPNRSDLRINTSNRSVQEGIPLRLILHVYDVNDSDGVCTPLKDAKVDIWHSNSQGVYSGVQDAGTSENDFLRGNQMTDDNGTVQFAELVHTQAPYSNHGPVDLTNERDFIYAGPSTDGLVQNNTGKQLMLNLKDDKDGYVGTSQAIGKIK
jgi:hypothetical protein